METVQTALGIVISAVVVTIVGIVVWNDVVRPRRAIDPGDQRERDQAKHGWYVHPEDHRSGDGS